MSYSSEMRVLRARFGLTQADMAKLLEISLNEIAGVELGRVKISREQYREWREKVEAERRAA